MITHLVFAYAVDWGWLRIGPPYIYINIDPVIVHLGPLALRWYGLMYVVGILVGLWIIRGYTARKSISQDQVYRILWWCIAAGLIGGRLRRPGVLILVYLYAYAVTQFLLFFTRDNVIVSFLGLDWGLKQAQWTAIVLFLALIPITFLLFRFSKPVPVGEVAATYGIPQNAQREERAESTKPVPAEIGSNHAGKKRKRATNRHRQRGPHTKNLKAGTGK